MALSNKFRNCNLFLIPLVITRSSAVNAKRNYDYLQHEGTSNSTQGDIRSACVQHVDHFLEPL